MRNYIDDSADYTLVYKYLQDPESNPLTPEEIARLDQDGDGVITENDLIIIGNNIGKLYSATLRSRADIDNNGYVDDFDYYLLETVINNGSVTYIDNRGKEIYLDLRNYIIPFQLGWFDVQTEAILEYDVNSDGNISEVTK